MSEHQPENHEKGEHQPTGHNSTEHRRPKQNKEPTKAEIEHGSTESLDAIRDSVEKQAPLKHELSHVEKQHKAPHPVLINKQLKETAFSRSMTRTRKKLSAPSKAFSKVIHAPAVDKSSDFIGRTIARPTGMLWGAVFAFFGTSALLWVTKYYGYEYNYLLVVILFVSGAFLGTAAEGLWHLVRKKNT